MTSRNAVRHLPPALLRQVQRHVNGLVWIPFTGRRRVKTRRDVARDRRIRAARKRGWSIRRIAARFGLSPTRVWEICEGSQGGRRGR